MILKSMIELIDEIETNCYLGDNEEALIKVSKLIDELEMNHVEDTRFLSILNIVLLALEKKDYILVADYLEYLLKPILLENKVLEINADSSFEDIPNIDCDIFYLCSNTNELVLCVKSEDGHVVRFNSPFSPEHEADVIYSSINMKKTTPVVCLMGIGTGVLAKKILDNLSDSGRLIIFEPDNKIINYCISCSENDECDDAELLVGERIKSIIDDKRVVMYFPEKNEVPFINILCGIINYRSLYGLVFCINSGYKDFYPKKCLDFIRGIEDLRRFTLTNKGTLYKQKDYYIDQIFRNIKILKKINLANEIGKIIPKDIPVVLVSAGPSLKKNVELLNKLKGHSLIVAVDTAVRFLMTHDIIPDLTITIDPQKNEACYEDYRSRNIPCIVDMEGNSNIIDKLNGRIFILTYNAYTNNLLHSIGKEFLEDSIGGGSVATTMFALLINLEFKKIIFVGQDLASSGGKTHALEENDGNIGDISIEGIDGEKVLTRNDWLVFLKWYEIQIEKQKNTDKEFRVIDATEGGAKIRGTEIMTLQEAIEDCRDKDGSLPDFDFEKELKKLDYYLNNEEYARVCQKHKNNIFKLKELIIKADNVVRKCNKIIIGIEEGTVSPSYVQKEKDKMVDIYQFYKRSPMYSLINDYLNGTIVDEVSRLSLEETNAEQTDINGIKLLEITFENIISVTEKIIENAKKYEALL